MKKLILFLPVLLLAVFLCGCVTNPAIVAADEAAKVKADAIKNQSLVDQAAAKAKAELAANDPLAHPVASLESQSAKTNRALWIIGLGAFVMCGLGVGLDFTALSGIGKILAPVAGGLWVFCLAGIIALSLVKLFAITAGLFVVWFGYEVYHTGSLNGAWQVFLSLIGLGTKSATAIAKASPDPLPVSALTMSPTPAAVTPSVPGATA